MSAAARFAGETLGPLRFSDLQRTAYIVASGASILLQPIHDLPAAATIAVSDVARLYLKRAAVCYAADIEWYETHAESIRAFPGERWIAHLPGAHSAHPRTDPRIVQRAALAASLGLLSAPGRHQDGLCRTPGEIHLGVPGGANSALQAMSLAWLWGARRLVLIGVDLSPSASGRAHAFGEHPAALRIKRSDYVAFRHSIELLVADLNESGVDVINCSPISTIEGCWHQPLEQVLGSRV